MKILIVEDDMERMKVFRWMFEDHKLYTTDKADEAIYLIDDIRYDYIFLDHDLGGKEAGYMHHMEPNTGYRVCKYIPESVNKNTPILIHSWNPYGSDLMFKFLREHNCKVIRRQFGTFSIEILEEFK